MTTTAEDLRQLDLLSIFHYVVGAILGLFSCMPLMHVAMGLAMISGSFFGEESAGHPPAFMGWMFLIMGLCFVLGGWICAVCILIAGRKLKLRQSRTFCLVVAGVECMFMPFGTVLGVFTLIHLSKESVRAVFDGTTTTEVAA